MKSRIIIPRQLLLVEIERRCPDSLCNARVRIGLTKEEARAYLGFECERCGHSWDDELTERDVPEWWQDLKVTGLDSIRKTLSAGPEEPNEVVIRMSDDFRRTQNKVRSGDDSF